MKRIVMMAVFLCSLFALASPFGADAAPTVWSGSGPGTTTVVSDGTATDPLFTYDLNPAGFNTVTWDFTTVAAQTGPVTLGYEFSGLHAWYQVTAFLNATVNGVTVAPLVNAGPQNCCTPPSNGFTYTGSVTLNVNAGDAYGFRFGGGNFDANNSLRGTLKVHIANMGRPDSKGTDFWLMFTGNIEPTPPRLFITSDKNASGFVELPGMERRTPFSVAAGKETSVTLPGDVVMSQNDVVGHQAVHVTSNAEVSVYGLNTYPGFGNRPSSTDAFLGLPTDVLGTEYIVLSYPGSQGSEFGIVPTQGGTHVTIIPSSNAGARPAGVPYEVFLEYGFQTYQLWNDADLSGTVITSDKPIAVFGGHRCASVPNGHDICSHLVEEMPPVNTWGKKFFTVPLATRPNGDIFRFLAGADDTTVMVNGAPVAVLDRGQVHERNIAGQAAITANAPILVAQYADSVSSGGVIAKPFMMLVPPVEQFLAGYSVTTPVGGYDGNRINVVAPAAAVGSVMLDGSAIPAARFTAIVGSGFSGAQIDVTPGSHLLVGSQPFGVSVYGFDADDSYGYPGGQMLAPVGAATQLTLLPPTAAASLAAQHCVQATVTDQAGGPLAGVRVDFTVTGVHPAQRSLYTNASGQANFCYIGTHLGVDTVHANVGGLSTTATVTWEEALPQGGLTAAPASVPADNVSAATITLTGATPGHRVRLLASLAGTHFVAGTGTVDAGGGFSATLTSSTAGAATITAYDETEDAALATATCVIFTPLSGQPSLPLPQCSPVVITDVKSTYPLDGRYLQGISAANRITVTVSWGAGGPGRVDFILNSTTHAATVTGRRAYASFDMGTILVGGQNSLRIVTYDAAGRASPPKDYAPYSIQVPGWLSGLLTSAAVAPLGMGGATQGGFELQAKIKYPMKPWVLGGQGSSTKLSIFVGGSVRLPLNCDGPARITAEAGLNLKGELKGIVLGGELKGSGLLEGRSVRCELQTINGTVRLDLKLYAQKNWPVMIVLSEFLVPGSGVAVLQFMPKEYVSSLGEVYVQGNLRGYLSGDAKIMAQDPYFEWTKAKLAGGAGIEAGYQFEKKPLTLKLFVGAFGLATFSGPGPLYDLSSMSFDNFTVRGEAGFTLQLFWFEKGARGFVEWRLASGSAQSLASPGSAAPTWRLIGHPAGRDYAVFRAMDPAKEAFAFPAAMTSEAFASPAATTVVTSVLVSNVYTYTEPSLALHPSTGNALMLWVHDDIARPVGQAQEIDFSRWNGSAWSAPAGLTNDNLLDGAPSVAWSGSGKALAVWHRLNATLPITATWDVTTALRMEIATASYDLALNKWSPVTLLTNNSSLDMEPQLVRNAAGGLLAAWRQNDAGLVNGTEADPDRIMTAFYGTAWSAPASAVEGIPGVNELAAGYGDGAATLAYSQFITPTGTITPVLQLFTTAWNGSAWTAPVRRTDDDLNHTHPQVAYTAANQPLLVWLAGKELRLWNLATGFQSAVAVPEEIGTPDEFRLVQDAAGGDLAAFFTAQAAQRDLFVMFYDQPSGLWGKPFRLSSDTLSEAYPAPAIDAAGRLLAGYTATTITGVSTTTTDPVTGEVITYTVPTEGQTDLMTLSHPFVRNLTIADGDLAVSDEHPAPGSSVTISATVRNTGDRPVAGVVVGLYDGNPQQGGTLIGMRSLPGLLQGGFTQTVTVTYLLPDTGGVSTLYALADPANAVDESDESDNSAHLKAFGPDLAFEDAGPEYWGGNDVGLVTVIRNRGTTASPATSLAFHRDALTGTLITANAVPPLAAGQEITLITDWNHGDLPAGDHTLAVEVNPGQADFDEAVTTNNATELKLSVQPDLVVSSQYMWAAVQPDGLVAITATVTNQGSAAAPPFEVDIYADVPFRDAGRVARLAVPALAAGGQAVVATDWAPTSSGQHTLYAVANPDRVLSELTWSNNVASTSVEAGPPGRQYLPLTFRGR